MVTDKPSDESNQPTDGSDSLANAPRLSTEPLAHIVLFQPEIPQNTGNIGRSCVAVGAHLWIVKPAAFQLDDRHLRRAGLDYWQHLTWRDVPDWTALEQALQGRTFWYFSRFATRSIWDAPLQAGDVFVFGSETNGLPPSIKAAAGDHALKIPMTGPVRSLNLATSVGIALFELARRQQSSHA